MVDFCWPVSEGGYRWVGEDGRPARLGSGKLRPGSLPDVHLEPVGDAFRETRPQKVEGLFRVFAATPPTPQGILAFAAEHGHLGADLADLPYDLEEPEVDTPDSPVTREAAERWREWAHRLVRLYDPLHTWVRALTDMRRCVDAWDGLHGSRKAPEERAEVLAGVLEVARVALRAADLRVAFVREKSLSRSPSGFSLQLVPPCLLAALWLQFAEAVTRGTRHRACEACGRWFEVGPAAHRRSRAYCSEACRSRAYRVRVDRALRLHAEGRSAAEIAAALGSTPDTVAGWLREAGR